jgi:hypothetical protein
LGQARQIKFTNINLFLPFVPGGVVFNTVKLAQSGAFGAYFSLALYQFSSLFVSFLLFPLANRVKFWFEFI